VDVARAAQALAPRVAPLFLNGKNSLNIQSLQDSENIPIQFFCHKMHKNYN
jgi:hypothetical protein